MARTTSEMTYKKIDYVKDLLKSNGNLTQRDIRQRVHKKFGTGISFKHIACLVRGEDPLAPATKRKKSKKRGAAKAAGQRKSTTNGKSVALSESPRFFISVPGESILSGFDKKTEVRNEIARLVEAGVNPEEIAVYGQEAFDVKTSHVVNF